MQTIYKIIIILGSFLFIPLLSISQQILENSLTDDSKSTKNNSYKVVNIKAAEDYLKNATTLELTDWGQEADRKVNMFYKYLSYLIDTDIDKGTKREAAMMAIELFADSTMVCDSLLLTNTEQIVSYEVKEFLRQMIDFNKNNIDITYLCFSNKLFFDPNTTTKTYNITESITFTMLSDRITYFTSKTVIVHFIFLESSTNDKEEFVVKLGDINFGK